MDRISLLFPHRSPHNLIFLWGLGVILGLSYLTLPGYIYAVILICGGIILVGVMKPEYAYLLLILTLIEEMVHLFVKTPVTDMRFYPYVFPLMVTVTGWMIGRVTGRFPERKATPIDMILLAIVAGEILSVIWSPALLFGILTSLFLLFNLLLFYISTAIITDRDILRRAVKAWIIAGVITATGAILSQWIDVSSNIYLTKTVGFKLAFQELFGRPSGLAGVDHVAGFMSMAIAMSLGVLTYEKSTKRKFLYSIPILYILYAMILTKTRATLIGLMGAYIFFIFIHPHFKRKLIRYSFLFMFVVLFIVLVGQPGLIDRMLIGFGYTGPLYFSAQDSYSGAEADVAAGVGLSGFDVRVYWWKNSLREMIAEPLKLLFGLGIGGFIYYSKGSPEVNSVSFAFFYDMGIFGVILFIIFMAILVTNLYHYLKNADRTSYTYYILLASTTALIADPGIHGLMDYDLTSYGSKFFWFPLGFTMAVLNILKKEEYEGREKTAKG